VRQPSAETREQGPGGVPVIEPEQGRGAVADAHVGEATYAVRYTAKLRQAGVFRGRRARRDPAGGRRRTHRVTSLCTNLRSRHTFWLLARATDIGHKGCKIADTNAGQVPPPALVLVGDHRECRGQAAHAVFREIAATAREQMSSVGRNGASTLSDRGSGANPRRCALR
jgi:hypothetical protein